jgi:hypothetical protein
MGHSYPSDITREQFDLIKPILESARKKTRPRRIDFPWAGYKPSPLGGIIYILYKHGGEDPCLTKKDIEKVLIQLLS